MRRQQCSGCGCGDLRTFLDLGATPIADAYTDNPDDPADTYPLEVAVCGKCWLVQLLEVVDHHTLFGTGYSFYTSASPPLSAYHKRYANEVLDRHGDLARRFTVEIGCNDGDLLRHFAAAGCRTIGVDPATGPVHTARERNLSVTDIAFTTAAAQHLRDGLTAHGVNGAGLVIANHVLAHVADVADMLAGIAYLLADDGVAIIEVQYLPDLLVNNAFDLVYHEHRNFFSLGSLARAASRWGLHVVDAELTDRQGGSIRATLSKTRWPGPTAEVFRIHASEAWLVEAGTYDGMQGRADRIRARLWDLLAAEKEAGRSVAGYGAPAKATTLLHFCRLTTHDLSHVVDTTPAKQGRHIPGTGLRIVAPGGAPDPDTFLLTSWNYASVILRNHTAFTAAGGRWILPIPAPTLL